MHATLRDPEPPLTRSVEDYLKAIYHLSSQGGFAATSDIASLLEVAPPSVSGMVKRLSETGLIEHVPYRGVQLTAQGRRAALRMIRRHRVLEVYLSQQLGYDWDGVHTEAERLEHAVSDELIERMAKALGDPQYDPHGAPIPAAACPEPRGGLPYRPRRPADVVAQGTGVRGARLSRGRGLHGSGQLGHRPRRGLGVRLLPPQRHSHLEPDGDPVAGARREARDRDRPGPRAGVPRPLLAPDVDRPVGAVRGRDCRLRPRRGDRVGDRAEPLVRDPAPLGDRDHRARRAAGAVAAAQGLPPARGAGRHADRDDRGMFHLRDLDLAPRAGRRRRGVRPRAVDPA